MRWQFVLRDRLARSVVELAETTKGPQLLGDGGSADAVMNALLKTVVERVGSAVAKRKAATACVSGITQTCVGPNGCQGAQFCIDGTHFSPCDCTSKP
jgi:hypothetical protein